MAYSPILKPSTFMNTLLYSGNGASSHAISGAGFEPNAVWIKERSSGSDHGFYDSVRGANKHLEPNKTTAEDSATNQLMSFNSDGFTVGASGLTNESGQTYVGWNWKAGTSVSGNTGGSGASKAYSGSVSTTSGFSIIKYLGNQTAGHTIPHHLGAVPRMIIVKRIDGASAWHVYNGSLGATKRLSLNTADAEDSDSTAWNNTTPTSSVFTVGDSGTTNVNNANTIAYCYAEKQGFSKFATYVGNGNANGPFVYTGFKPAFLMIKKSNASENWYMVDNKRNPFNIVNDFIKANEANAGNTTSGTFNFFSNGFKNTASGGGQNESNHIYTYMAFAENPFVASNFNAATAR